MDLAFPPERALRREHQNLLRRNPALLRGFVRYDTPLMLGQAVWAVNQFGRGFFVGRMAPAGTAAASVADTADGLVWMLPPVFAQSPGDL